MPYGFVGSPDGPKSGWRSVEALSMLASHAALCESTGRLEMSVFQTLSAGYTGQFGAPGTGVPAAAGTAVATGVSAAQVSATANAAAILDVHPVPMVAI